jgi:hypothetical protein
MFGFPARFEMKIRVVSRGGGSLHRHILILLDQLLEAVKNFLRGQVALLHPSFEAACGAHPHVTPVAFEDFQAIAIFDHSGLVVNRGHLITQSDLGRGNISDLAASSAATVAARKRQYRCRQEHQPT